MTETEFQGVPDIIDIKIEQARQLKDRIVRSCMFVEMVILYIFVLLYLGGYPLNAIIWLVTASAMVAISFIYAKVVAPSGIDRENVDKYLVGHVIISCLTGIAWGLLAIYFVDWDSPFSLFVATTIVCTIVVGGSMPGATYRPGFIGLATFMLIPFGLYVTLFAHGPYRLAGFGILILYVYGIASNSQAQRNSQAGLFARQLNELNSQIRSQNDVIRRVNEEKTRFLAATSHDFSQPLHAQGYFIQSLDALLEDKDQIALLKKIETSWKHQKRLLQGLVEINRLDSGTIVPKMRVIDLETRMRDLAGEFEAVAADKLIIFETNLSPVNVYTDPLLLSRVVQNLVSNAIRYTPKKGKVTLEVSSTSGMVQIEVKDTGPGIAAKQHERIFEEYVQLHESQPDQEIGLGLGLSIVKRLTSLLEIEMQMESEPGTGTRFKLSLPLYDKKDGKLATGAAVPSNINGSGNDEQAPLIVLVDDERAIRQSMSILLSNWGYQLITASGPDEAIKLLSETDTIPALLIIDKRLGRGKSGVDLIRALREEVNEDTRAILMSGDLSTRLEDIDVPIDRFLSKPIEPDDIRRVILETIAD